MSEEENAIKGGVIIVGSLFWEKKDIAIEEKESIDLAEKRRSWRETYLDLDNRERCQLPIRYGRCSSSRKCTYTMVFSSLALNEDSFGLAITYKGEIDFSNYLHFERQAKVLAEIEGISKNNDKRLRKSWACIGIYINPNSVHSLTINNHWDNLRMIDNEYANKSAENYRVRNLNGDYSLLDDKYRLRPEVSINTRSTFDFLFFTYIKPEHRNKTIERYPTPQEIAEEINRSGYKTYFEENVKSGITTFEDSVISPLI